MIPNRFAFVALGMACIMAATVGGYLAVKQNAIPTPASATSVTVPSRTPGTSVELNEPAAPSVDPSARAAVNPPAAAPTTPAKRVEPRPVEPRPAPPTAAKKATIPAPATSASNTRRPLPALDDHAPITPPATVMATPSAPFTPTTTMMTPPDSNVTARVDERAVQELPRAQEPPRKIFEELVVSANSVIGLQTENRISSETARVEDRVEARVTRDVRVSDTVAVPAGSRVIGSVTVVERGGKFKERARLGLRFETLVLPDGTRLPIRTETVFRDGESPTNGSAAKLGGGAAAGAILGAILGGAKGAAIGATAGAGGGAAAVAASDRSSATLPVGTPMTIRILSPITVIIEK